MPVSTALRQNGSQERPASLTSTTSSSGSSRDSHSAMEEPTGSEASAQNGAGSPRGRHAPNSNNNSSSWLNMKGPLSPFNSRAAAGPAHHKLSYVGRVVREIVETERMYVQDLRSIVEVSGDAGSPLMWTCLYLRKERSPLHICLRTFFPWSGGEASEPFPMTPWASLRH